MPVGRVLHCIDDAQNKVYFPTDSIVAPLHVAGEATAHVAVIGNEGMTGWSLSLAGEAAMRQTMVQCPGHAFRLDADVLHRESRRNAHFYTLLLRYSRVLIGQMAQAVACNSRHPLEQRLCRWLLLTLDRVASPELPLREEVVEKVLGAPRDQIHETLQTFATLGVIQRGPDHLAVPDRRRLELGSCECYSQMRGEADPAQQPKVDKLIDAFPELTNAVVDGLNSDEQSDLIKQLQGALIRGVSYDIDADAASISLVAMYSPRAIQRNVFASAHGRRIPIECQFWTNLDIDHFGRITAIEIMHPPEALRKKLQARARS